MRFDSQLSRKCQTFSTGLSSGHLGGSGMSVMFHGQFGDAMPSGLIEQETACAPGPWKARILRVHLGMTMPQPCLQRG